MSITRERIEEALGEETSEDFYHDNPTAAVDDLNFWREACELLLGEVKKLEGNKVRSVDEILEQNDGDLKRAVEDATDEEFWEEVDDFCE